jgi:heat shock protein HtpX
MWNTLKTTVLLGALSGLLLLGGQMLGGQSGLTFALVMALVMNFASFFFSDKIALSMTRAEPLTPESNPQVWRLVGPMTQRLCERMGLPMPKLWLIPDRSPNAFATGRGPANASVALNYGLLEIMNEREVEGVIAHELGHIKNRDILIASIAATIATALTYVAQMGLFFGGRDDEDRPNPMVAILLMITAPIAAGIIQMAISRTREFGADAAAAKYTGSPDGLISALQTLDRASRRLPTVASPGMSHMYIFPPMATGFLQKLLSTHPPMEERIAALRQLR